MNLHEQLNRTKELMGLKPLNEQTIKQSGKLKDLIKQLFRKGSKSEGVADRVDPYFEKYGEAHQGTHIKSTITEGDAFCYMDYITNPPSRLESNPKEVFTTQIYYLQFYNIPGGIPSELKSGDKIPNAISYEYTKCLFLVDGQVRDEISTVFNNKNLICSTSTLEKQGNGCEFPEEFKKTLITTFQNNKNLNVLENFLNKLR